MAFTADFTAMAVGARPTGWTPTGAKATNASAWLVENRGGGVPNDCRAGDIVANGEDNELLAPSGPAGASGTLGLARATYKHVNMRAGFGESSAGLGLCATDRGGTLQPSGFFVSGSYNVDSRTLSLGLRFYSASGVLGFPGASFSIVMPAGTTTETSFTIELERYVANGLRFRAYRTGDTPPAWATVALDSTQQLLTGRAALFYRHSNGNTIANARYETFTYISGDPINYTRSAASTISGIGSTAARAWARAFLRSAASVVQNITSSSSRSAALVRLAASTVSGIGSLASRLWARAWERCGPALGTPWTACGAPAGAGWEEGSPTRASAVWTRCGAPDAPPPI